ncbi:atpase aaa+ type core protein [Penicillium angulare]|uniref:Atpase aaa+ type core protein n=1 Tax=Penicillium angulare TaxID=116970 RepID=A0A9W9F7A6_9EURO|nr:atpase aaa+ type core protein [Penicillium angulare]
MRPEAKPVFSDADLNTFKSTVPLALKKPWDGEQENLSTINSEPEVPNVLAGEQSNPEPAEPKSPGIRYKLVVDGPWGETTLRQTDDPFDLRAAGLDIDTIPKSDADDGPPPIIEITSWARGQLKGKWLSPVEWEKALEDIDDKIQKPTTLDEIYLREVTDTKMIVHSPLLLEVIRQTVEYYPSQNLTGDTIIFDEPYRCLVHHFQDFEAQYQRAVAEEKNNSNDLTRQLKKHIEVLLEFIRPFEKKLKSVQSRLDKKAPTIRFEDVWWILRPGSFAYFLHEDKWIGCVIMSVKWKVKSNISKWNIWVWFLDEYWQDSGPCKLERVFKKLYIPTFEGERAIHDLPIVPQSFHDKTDDGERLATIEARSEKRLKILRNRNMQVMHSGRTLDTDDDEKGERNLTAPVIADDMIGQSSNVLPSSNWVFTVPFITRDKTAVDAQRENMGLRGIRVPEYHEVDIFQPEKVTKKHLFLLLPKIAAFAPDTKSWHIVHVDNVEFMDGNSSRAKLVIEDSNIDIIRALCSPILSGKQSWSPDFIRSKGEGVVILLHGPPGVGKTYTVEVTALTSGRPLLSLTIADLGTKEETIEEKLSQWLSLAERWRAVLLIDEADIFLERRKHTDLARNGIVSAFLRKMEYFRGVLFLTTNRVGHIDEAFLSRAQLIIGYKPLDQQKRKKIWEGFFEKLANERKGKIRVGNAAKRYVLEDEEILKAEWNGREIRNALYTAISLAQYEARDDDEGEETLVESEHFRRVLKVSEQFRQYYNSIKHDTSSSRARDLYGRNDDYWTEEKDEE